MNIREAHPAPLVQGGRVVPGALLADRWRVAGVVASVPGGLLVNALDERLRRRVRVLVAADHDPVRSALRYPLLPTSLATEREPATPRHAARWCVAFPFWEGAPLAIPTSPLTDHRAVRAWARQCITVLDLLERIHTETGRAHGHLSLESFWRQPDGHLLMLDVATAGAPDPRFAYPDDSADDPRADLYAAAAIFQTLATGTLPFGAGPSAPDAHRLLRSPDSDLLPSPMLEVLRTALQKQPHHRFASAGRMKAAFNQALVALDGRPHDPRSAPERVPVAYRLGPPPSEATLEPAPPRMGHQTTGSSGIAILVLAAGVFLSALAWVGVAGLLVALGQALP